MEMLSPLNTEYLRMIRLRTPICENPRFFKGIQYLFKQDTFILLEKLFRLICDMEVDVEEMRRKISDSEIRLKDVFKMIDLNSNGYVNRKDVRRFIYED